MKISPQFVRFCLVGAANTIVDTGIFLALRHANVPILEANIVSTSFGLALSLLLNFKYTFNDKALGPKKIALYIGVTLAGLWALQPIVIQAITMVDTSIGFTVWLGGLIGYESILNDLVPKLASIVVTLIWNYLWYSRVIFKNKTVAAERAIALD